MRDYRVFHETVLGHFHALRNLPLQDASACRSGYCREERAFHIAVTADGHGDPACTRSGFGAQKAVDAAIECLSDFAKEALAEPSKVGDLRICEKLLLAKSNRDGKQSLARQSQIVLRRLTDMIISRWYTALDANIREHPFSAQELVEAGINAEDYDDKGRRVHACAHAYGTTLLAALMLPELLILIQQGDGRCVVYFEENGNIEVDQPVPWDERCHDKFTTSLCDPDAAERIRFWVLDLRETPLAACYLGSDGVDDSFQEMMGTHMFYNRISCDLLDLPQTNLNKILSDLSAEGSGDDISISGIYCPTLLHKHIPALRMQAKRYGLEQELTRYECRKNSMDRKHSILQKRMEAAEAALADWRNKTKREQAHIQQELDNLNKRITEFQEMLDKTRQKIEQEQKYPATVLGWTSNGEYRADRWPSSMRIRDLFSLKTDSIAQLKETEWELYQEKILLMQKLKKITENQRQLEKDQRSQQKKLEQQAEDAQAEFKAYNLDYQTVDYQIISIQKEIELLHIECLETQQDAPTYPAATSAIAPMEMPYIKCDEPSHITSLKKDQSNTVKILPYSFPNFDTENKAQEWKSD